MGAALQIFGERCTHQVISTRERGGHGVSISRKIYFTHSGSSSCQEYVAPLRDDRGLWGICLEFTFMERDISVSISCNISIGLNLLC